MLNPNSSFEPSVSPGRDPAGGTSYAMPSPAEVSEPKIPVLGKTLLFRGELTAEEDVILQGRVEGSIRHARNLIIGTEGSVLGDVYANHLTVEGLVEGDLHCNEAVIVHATAQVRGNIFAPRVGIMEGALFNGRIEMEAAAVRGSNPQPQARPTAKPAVPARPPASPGVASARSGADASGRTATSAGAAATPAASPAGGPLGNSAVDQMLSTPGTQKK
ncbi:MAG TPA: polymer-forming cytoskeletal protein [Steroidobacteraceae bacterium]|jgi:cytoskeletal protein CcmA (bactofilin family)|nr:polymer-forming cytoskeletal protein [Steroidobacteraceae bacterium]